MDYYDYRKDVFFALDVNNDVQVLDVLKKYYPDEDFEVNPLAKKGKLLGNNEIFPPVVGLIDENNIDYILMTTEGLNNWVKETLLDWINISDDVTDFPGLWYESSPQKYKILKKIAESYLIKTYEELENEVSNRIPPKDQFDDYVISAIYYLPVFTDCFDVEAMVEKEIVSNLTETEKIQLIQEAYSDLKIWLKDKKEFPNTETEIYIIAVR